GDDLGIVVPKQLPRIGTALPASSDQGDVYLIAGSHEPAAAQDVPRHNREHRCGRAADLEEITPRGTLGLGHGRVPFRIESGLATAAAHGCALGSCWLI